MFKQFFLFLTVSFFCSQVFSAESPSQALHQLLTQMQSMQASFTQLIQDNNTKKIKRMEGTMKVKRPGQFLWETRAPLNQLIVSDGKKVAIYDKDLEQVTIQDLDPKLTNTPALLLSGEVNQLDKNFSIEGIAAQNSKGWNFILRPKAADSEASFESMKLTFEDKKLVDMNLVDHLGQKTMFNFYDIQLNQPIDSAVFNFFPPAGVDVIDQTTPQSE